MSDVSALFGEAAAKVVVYLAAQFAVGVGVAHRLAQLVAPTSAALAAAAEIDRALRRRAMWAALLLLPATAVRAVAHTLTAFGTLDGPALWTTAIESRWGHAWQLQIAAAALLCISAAGLRPGRSFAWPIYSASSLIICASIPLLGHAAGSPWRHALHGVHIAASGLWLGTLAVVVSLFPLLRRVDRSAPQRLIARFASFALPGAALLVVTGSIASFIYVRDLANVYGTAYGRTLTLKVLLATIVAATGFRNWRLSRHGGAPRPGTIGFELGVALLVVIATGLLTELEHP